MAIHLTWWVIGLLLMGVSWGLGALIDAIDPDSYGPNPISVILGFVGIALFFGVLIGHFV